jgi:hypothetical protein
LKIKSFDWFFLYLEGDGHFCVLLFTVSGPGKQETFELKSLLTFTEYDSLFLRIFGFLSSLISLMSLFTPPGSVVICVV